MKTAIYKFISIVLLTWMVFSISYYTLRAVLIEYRDMQIVLTFIENDTNDFLISYNIPPYQAGSDAIKNKIIDNKLKFPYPKYINLDRIYITSELNKTLYLESLHIENSYLTISLQAVELFSHIDFLTSQNQDSSIVKLVDNKLVLPFTEINTVLQFKSTIVKNFRSILVDRLRVIAVSIAAIALILFILIFFSKMELGFEVNSQFIFCLFFLLLIFTPFFSQKHHSTYENRKLAPFPDLNVNVWKIPSRYTKYYNDHFPYKAHLTQFNNYIRVKVFNTSPNPENVRFNQNGWLFYSTKKIKTAYQGIETYSNSELETIKKKLEQKVRLLKDKGIDFYLMIPPLKHTVYFEELPPGMQILGETKRDQLMRYLKENSALNLIDPLPLLKSLKSKYQVYYKTDTHWNQMGAFNVYQLIIETIRQDHPELDYPLKLSDFDIQRTSDCEGDLINIINLRNYFCRQPYLFFKKSQKKSGNLKYGEAKGGEINYFYFQADSLKDKPRVLIYRDSYGEYLYPFLSEHFSYSGFAWDRTLNPERIEEAKPDIIILEIMERFIDHLLTENEYD